MESSIIEVTPSHEKVEPYESFYKSFTTLGGLDISEYSNIPFYAGLDCLYRKAGFALYSLGGYEMGQGALGEAGAQVMDRISKLQYYTAKKASAKSHKDLALEVQYFYNDLYRLVHTTHNPIAFLSRVDAFIARWEMRIWNLTSWYENKCSVPLTQTTEFKEAFKEALKNVKLFLGDR